MRKFLQTHSTAWAILLLASAFEIAFALGLKTTQGFTRLWPSVLTVLAGVTSFVLLSQALRTLPVGTGYAAWTGLGAVGAAVLGIALFGEPRGAARIASLALIVAGVVGLRLSAGEAPPESSSAAAAASPAGRHP
jgi:quaternary ammonium compound-resistance protein SugE